MSLCAVGKTQLNIALLGPSIIIIVNQPLQYVHQYSVVMISSSFCSTELKCGSGSTAAYCSCANHIRPSYLRRPLPHPLHCADCRLLVLWLLVVPPLHYTCHFLCPQCEHIFSSNYHKLSSHTRQLYRHWRWYSADKYFSIAFCY